MVDVDDKLGKGSSAGDSRMRLTCPVCGRVVPFTEAELLESIHRGWPNCCGEAMTMDRSEPGTDRTPPAGAGGD
jgi:hypothetical protein